MAAKIWPPNTAAVSVTWTNRKSYAEVMRLARDKLESLRIEDLRPRKAVTGAQILEIRGSDNVEKADVLANELREVMAHQGDVKIACPSKSVKLRVSGMDDSITTQEVASAVGSIGGCSPQDVKVTKIGRPFNGLGTSLLLQMQQYWPSGQCMCQ